MNMKKLLLLVLLAFPVALLAQNTYVLKGTIPNLKSPAKLFLAVAHSTMTPDSTTLKDGHFQFTGVANQPTEAILIMTLPGKSFEGRPLYIHQGTITLAGDTDIYHAKIMDSKINEDYQLYHSSVSKADSITTTDDLKKQFIAKYPGSFMSIVALNELAAENIKNVSELELMYNKLSKEVQNTQAGNEFKSWAEKAHLMTTGSAAPDFAEKDVNGKLVKLSDFRGQYVLLHFWASWCPGCRDQAPFFLATYNRFKNKNFKVLYVTVDEQGKRAAWLNAIKKDKVGVFTNVANWQSKVDTLYLVKAYPTNYLISPEGKIIATDITPQELEKQLSVLIP